jgi:hypothetical protein
MTGASTKGKSKGKDKDKGIVRPTPRRSYQEASKIVSEIAL